MTNIKVTYGSTSRRLSISSSTTWSELETQFHNLFNIPEDIQIIVSYTDEEGDVITLSSDLELQEVLTFFSSSPSSSSSSSSSSNNNKTIRFTLTTSDINRKKSVDTIIDEESLIDGVSSIQIEEQNSKNKHVTVADEVDEYSPQETRGENSKNVKNVTESTNDKKEENQESSDDDESEIIVIITRNPWSHRRRLRFGGCNPYYPYFAFGERSRGCHSGESAQQGHNNVGGCNRSRGNGCGRYYRRNQQISSEVVAEKINILNSMGFVNDNLEELVKRYNGNLEHIVEVLLLTNQQNEQNNEKNKERREENDQPMEVEEEGSTAPYVL